MNNKAEVKQKVIVVCRSCIGEPDIVTVSVECSSDEYDTNRHYSMAEEIAENMGYQGPFLCFPDSEHRRIAYRIADLQCPIPFALKDHSGDTDSVDISGSLKLDSDGVVIFLKGHSDCASVDDGGAVAWLEQYEGEASVRVYSDILNDAPTHNINLEGARNHYRG